LTRAINSRQHGRLPDLPAEFETINVRQHDIEENQVGPGVFECAQGAFGPPENLRLIAVAGEVVFNEGGKFGLVFDNRDLLRHGTCKANRVGSYVPL
jgi:hypothetical protein